MCSEGIDLYDPEEPPADPYSVSRVRPHHMFKTPNDFDKLKQFLELDRKVLRFFCVWDDRDNMFGEMKPFVSITHSPQLCTHYADGNEKKYYSRVYFVSML